MINKADVLRNIPDEFLDGLMNVTAGKKWKQNIILKSKFFQR